MEVIKNVSFHFILINIIFVFFLTKRINIIRNEKFYENLNIL